MAECLVKPMAPLGLMAPIINRGSSMYGFATIKVKPIYNCTVDVHKVLNNLYTWLVERRILFLLIWIILTAI